MSWTVLVSRYQDQDSKGKTETVTIKTKTSENTVLKLSQDETASWHFPLLIDTKAVENQHLTELTYPSENVLYWLLQLPRQMTDARSCHIQQYAASVHNVGLK